MEYLTLVWTFVIGLVLGSFYNVVVLRTLSEESIAFPPSHCTTCGHKLGIIDLVPIISWLGLRGKCRYCKSSISKMYPFGELLTAVSYTIIIWKCGLTVEAIPHILCITAMILSTQADIKEMMVPDIFIDAGAILVLASRLYLMTDIWYYILSGVGSYIVLYLVYVLSGEKLGLADVKIYGLIGLSIGVLGSVESLGYACTIASVILVPIFIIKKISRKTEIPFVPFITIGVLATYVVTLV